MMMEYISDDYLDPIKHYKTVSELHVKLEECKLLCMYKKDFLDCVPITDRTFIIDNVITNIFTGNYISNYGFTSAAVKLWKYYFMKENIESDIYYILRRYIENNREYTTEYTKNNFTGIDHNFSISRYIVDGEDIFPGMVGDSMCCLITILYVLPVTQILVPSNEENDIPSDDIAGSYMKFIDLLGKCINTVNKNMKKRISTKPEKIDKQLFSFDKKRCDNAEYFYCKEIIRSANTQYRFIDNFKRIRHGSVHNIGFNSDIESNLLPVDFIDTIKNYSPGRINNNDIIYYLRGLIDHLGEDPEYSFLKTIKSRISSIVEQGDNITLKNFSNIVRHLGRLNEDMKKITENKKLLDPFNSTLKIITYGGPYNIETISQYINEATTELTPLFNKVSALVSLKDSTRYIKYIFGEDSNIVLDDIISELLDGNASKYNDLLRVNREAKKKIISRLEINLMLHEWYQTQKKSVIEILSDEIKCLLNVSANILDFYRLLETEINSEGRVSNSFLNKYKFIYEKSDSLEYELDVLAKNRILLDTLEIIDKNNTKMKTMVSKINEIRDHNILPELHSLYISLLNSVKTILDIEDIKFRGIVLPGSNRVFNIDYEIFPKTIKTIIDDIYNLTKKNISENDLYIVLNKKHTWEDICYDFIYGNRRIYNRLMDTQIYVIGGTRGEYDESSMFSILEKIGFNIDNIDRSTFLENFCLDSYVMYTINHMITLIENTSFLESQYDIFNGIHKINDGRKLHILRDAYNKIHTFLNYNPKFIRTIQYNNSEALSEFKNDNTLEITKKRNFLLDIVNNGKKYGHKFLDVTHFSVVFGNYSRQIGSDKHRGSFSVYRPIAEGDTYNEMYCSQVRNAVIEYINKISLEQIIKEDKIILRQLTYRLINVIYDSLKYKCSYEMPRSYIPYDSYYVYLVKNDLLKNYDDRYCKINFEKISSEKTSLENFIIYISMRMLNSFRSLHSTDLKNIYLTQDNHGFYMKNEKHKLPIVMNVYPDKKMSGDSVANLIRKTAQKAVISQLSNPYIMYELTKKNDLCPLIYNNIIPYTDIYNGNTINIYLRVPEKSGFFESNIFKINIMHTDPPHVDNIFTSSTSIQIIDIDVKDNLSEKFKQDNHNHKHIRPNKVDAIDNEQNFERHQIDNEQNFERHQIDILTDITTQIDNKYIYIGNDSFDKILKLYTSKSYETMDRCFTSFYNMLNVYCFLEKNKNCMVSAIVPNYNNGTLSDNINISTMYSIMHASTLQQVKNFMIDQFAEWQQEFIQMIEREELKVKDRVTVIRVSEYINEDLRAGDTVKWDFFVSTSNYIVVIDNNPGSWCFYITFSPKKCKKWLCIGGHSEHPSEAEILFAPGQRFRVVKVLLPEETEYGKSAIGYGRHVYMEHIPDNDNEQSGGSILMNKHNGGVKTIHEWPVINRSHQIGGSSKYYYKYKKYKTKYNNLNI